MPCVPRHQDKQDNIHTSISITLGNIIVQIKATIKLEGITKELRSLKSIDTNPLWKSESRKFNDNFKQKVPKDTGEYKKSWKVKKYSKKGFTLETKMGFLFDILEFQGSKPHIIEPVRASVLHWIDKETGQDRFAMRVRHPGFKAIPHARPFVKKNVMRVARDLMSFYKSKKEWIT